MKRPKLLLISVGTLLFLPPQSSLPPTAKTKKLSKVVAIAGGNY